MRRVAVSEDKVRRVRRAMKASGLDPDPLTDDEVVDQALTVAEFYFAEEE
ncbi:MAG TPA: hypothetical protein VLT35_03860 [Methanocella sp.]|nr:hypothetical protein [Methanocella sp.]